MVGAIAIVGLLRLIGFASTVLGTTMPAVLVVQYVAMAAAVGGGLYVIRTGVIIEPPAFLVDWIATLTDRISQRLSPAVK